MPVPKKLSSNDLNRYVTIHELIVSDAIVINDTDDGEWVEVGKEWCQMLTQGSIEFLAADSVQNRTLYLVTMRWSPKASSYTAKMRMEYQGRIFNIAGPPQNVDEKDRWLQFNAIEVPPT